MHFEARFSAVGGQGIILAGTIIADAAFLEGLYAAGSPTYTAQVRGGPTKVDIIVDSEEILFPRTAEIDFFLSLATNSYKKFGTDLKEGAIVMIDPALVTIPDEHRELYKVYEVPIIQLTSDKMGRMVYTSAVALGTMVALTDVVSEESIRKALKTRAPKGTESYNMKALSIGIDYVKEMLAKGVTT
ncbi:MAG: 2-oxoacid:acceptor oxidoreductase family protein [Candidatus Electryonea clarkiae]|nr:2-oxoacid:acceptor oxidoreductase family protein [Candidatus Electryonea clarkiae]MDP8288702.1 2-oxoacid:acceptor oxidoreductase family protein [Candidatus Electryonea clarkiae]